MITVVALFYIFSSFCISCSFFVIFSKNPVYAVFFLILTFCNVSSLLFLLRLEFLPIIFIVIYVGAIAVLFLFVMMMLNIKTAQKKVENAHYVFLGFVFAAVFIIEVFFLLRFELVPLIISNKKHLSFLSDFFCVSSSFSDFFCLHYRQHNVNNLGLVLFTEYFNLFIVSGFILLFAMLGTIVLTLHKKFTAKSQNIYAQVLRDHKTSVNLYN
jgi:NADH-quinone oxidoreductase subunit J